MLATGSLAQNSEEVNALIEEVVGSIREAERQAEALVQKAGEDARARAVAARAEADALLERAEEEAQAISAKYRKMGDEVGRKKAAEILRIRKEQFAANVTAARERVPQAVAFILERIG